MSDLELRRRFFAEELEAVCTLKSPALVDAFATVPREQFLRPGPWTVLGEGDALSLPKARITPDADPARVSHNVAIAIDPARQLFNGQPGTIGSWIDALELAPGARVLHVGCGLGYYTGVMAHCVGAAGRRVA
jgi:protein-L-isoaspartate(D-aspartate) O-methyltransferase